MMGEAIIVGIFTLAGVGLAQLFNEIRARRQAEEGDRRTLIRDRLKAYSQAKARCSKLRDNIPPRNRLAGSTGAGWTDPFLKPYEIASECMEWWKGDNLFLDDETSKAFYRACNLVIVYCGKQLGQISFVGHEIPDYQNITKFIEYAEKALHEGTKALTKGC